MKKITLILIVSILFTTTFTISSCKKNDGATKTDSESSIDKNKNNINALENSELDISPIDTSIAGNDFFKLDYRPVKSEEPSVAGKAASAKYTGSGDLSSITIQPAEKKISDYKIKYHQKKSSRGDTLVTIGEGPAEDTSLEIIEWGPKEETPAEVKRPSFYVIFNKPIIALQMLGAQSDVSKVMKIEPPVKGVFRWYGTGHLSFETKESLNPRQTYKITISSNVRALDGSSLKEDFSFTTKTSELKITNIIPGFYFSKKNNVWLDETNLPLDAAKEIRLAFNYPVKANEIKNTITISSTGKLEKTFTNYSVEQVAENSIDITLNEPLDFETTINVKVNDSTSVKSISTLKRFSYMRFGESYSHGKYMNPVNIYFSQPVDEKTVLGNISTEPQMEILKDNIEVSDRTLTIFNLPITFNSSYKINGTEKIKDIYGRNLSNNFSINIYVPEARSFVEYKDYGMRMLEAKFPAKMIFAYQNLIEGSVYQVIKTDDVLDPYTFKWDPSNKDAIKMKTEPRNTQIFETVDLTPYLDDGYGSVVFKSSALIKSEYSSRGYYESENDTSIQVTDLGATVRYGINKAVVLVTKLSTGEAVEGATVFISKKVDGKIITTKKISSTEKTNKQGIAILTPENFDSFSTLENYDTVFTIEKDKDKIQFIPNSHSSWRSGISTDSIKGAYEKFQRTFMFTDRGLYKPGETVTFRGIDKTQQLGIFKSYNGNYKIKLTTSSWYTPKTLWENDGETTESGGFYGSFTLPENIEPGEYFLTYLREENINKNGDYYDYNVKRIPITIAHFEKVKFQTSIEMPKSKIIAGDEIQATLSATYLAGGNLSGANYNNEWFKENWYFNSTATQFKGYVFGPTDTSSERKYISNERGQLSGDGTAKLKCKTTAAEVKGMPYYYKVSANVTDASNQEIGTSGNTVVHPASYYIGVSKPIGLSGFPKANTALKFNYALTNLEGDALANTNTLLNRSKANATVELIREEWKAVQQQGVYSVYTKYVRDDIVEQSQKIILSLNGTVSVTPQKAGHYILRISAKDFQERDVVTEYTFFATGSSASFWNRDNESDLRLTTDQSMYNPGDTAKVLLESPLPKGKYLITVEREGIFTEEVKDFTSSVEVIDIPIARNFVPVVYVSISSYSVRIGDPQNDFDKPDLDKPKQYYGATAICVNPRVKAFSVKVECDKPSYKPGETATITLTAAKGGQPIPNAEITLMAVDRGVLDLINYHVPDPINFFYDNYNFPLRCYGGDNRSLLMDPVTYEVKNLAGGDSDESKIEERKDFNPTAYFNPMLITDDNGKVTATFDLPDSLTTYRVTAFGVCDELLALQEDEIAVRNPINVQSVLPRRLRERDTSEAGVLITNLDANTNEIIVTLNIESPTSEEDEDGYGVIAGDAFIDSASTQSITLKSGQSGTVYFNIAAKKAGTINTVFKIESDVLTEKLIMPLVIEKPYIFETVTTTGVIDETESSATEAIIIPSAAENSQGNISVTVDATRLGLLGDAVNYVFDYPYGCLEQQSSKILPLVIFDKYIKVFGMDSKVANPKKLVKKTFAKWEDSQLNDGGFPYWQGGNTSSDFVSLRIAECYSYAMNNGYSERDLKINKTKLSNYITKEIVDNAKKSDYMKIYAAYVLTMLGDNNSVAKIESLIDEDKTSISEYAFAGLANYNAGKIDNAKKYFEKIKTYMRPTARGIDITKSGYNNSYYCNSNIEELALSLKLFTLIDKDDLFNTKILFSLLQTQRKGYWQNTATTSRVLASIATVIKENNIDATNIETLCSLDGKEILREHIKGTTAKPVTAQNSFENFAKDKQLPLEINRKGKGDLFYTASMSYALPEELQDARDEGIGLFITIVDAEDETEIQIDKTTGILNLESGKTYKAKVFVSSTYDRTYLAIRTPIPSGCEVLDSTFATTPTVQSKNNFTNSFDDFDVTSSRAYDYYNGHYMSNQNIYDNEIHHFYDDFRKGDTTFTFNFRAVRKGMFAVPPATASCMYEEEVSGRTSGYLCNIK